MKKTGCQPNNIEQVLIELHESKSYYYDLLEKDKRGELAWNDLIYILSPARGRYLEALRLAVETGYALKRRFGLE